MTPPKHVYVTYIRTTPEQLWEAITDPAWTARYFHGTRIDLRPERGAKLVYRNPDESLAVDGEVLDVEVGKRLSVSWRSLWSDALAREAASRVTFEIEAAGAQQCRLTVIHDRLEASPRTAEEVGQGWPWILSSLKSVLETGEALPTPGA